MPKKKTDDLIQGNDGHWVREVGHWAEDKYHFLSRYLDAFTTAMRNKWGELHYVDLFAGPGLSQIRDTEIIINGSPIMAAALRYKFTQLHLCDLDARCINALEARLKEYPQLRTPKLYQGDANVKVHDIVRTIPASRTLSLAFLDPSGLHLHYTTLEVLATRQIDLIVFFPDSYDAVRNWDKYYSKKENSNLDKVLGPGTDWREKVQDCSDVGRELRQIYQCQIKRLGYKFQTSRRISDSGRPLYVLLFCSKNKMGLDIWEKTSLINQDGQREFGFD